MVKNTKTEEDVTGHDERLREIAGMKFENLSDDEVLGLLAERKHLEELRREYEKLQKEEEARLLLEQKNAEKLKEAEKRREALVNAIERLNRSISPDKADDELLSLVAERKELEKELESIGTDPSQSQSATTDTEPADVPKSDAIEEDFHEKRGQETEDAVSVPSKTAVPEEASVSAQPSPELRSSLKEEFGSEGILAGDLKEGGELHRYLDQLKNNTGSLGTLLQEMPIAAKRNKKFMLQVAEIDSAYAMHYAADTLKKDEDFNVRIAAMKNPRNSGNAIAEMLPEARTSKVVLAGVKQDYRNIKFIQPNMDEYDEMMRIAKKVALEKIKDLKDAADMALLIPRPLQQDKQFMAEVKKITAKEKEKAAA